METFKINNKLEIVCEWKKTRNGFKHEATLMDNWHKVDKTKICYLNRTWESFEFESVITQLLNKTKILTNKQKSKFMENCRTGSYNDISEKFGFISAIAKMGDLFGQSQKEKNDWKTRMIKAGLENDGLIMPDNWDDLPENDRTKRLDRVIKSLSTPLK